SQQRLEDRRKRGIADPVVRPSSPTVAAQSSVLAKSAYTAEEFDQARVRCHWCFKMDEMTRLFGDLPLRVLKVLWQAIHPGARDHRVVSAPVEAARHHDFRQCRRTIAHQPHTGGMSRSIPGKTAFEIAGPHKVVDEVIDLTVEGVRRMRPV